jgi:hypothetical protein
MSINVSFDKDGTFKKEMDNIMNYSLGFLEGVQRGKSRLLDMLGKETIEFLKSFIDSNARVNPEALHHVYEWYSTGSPEARLFDLEYTVSGLGLSVRSTFRQSTSVKNGSTVPFYDKARIMENGLPVTIRPKRSEVLVFKDGEETVFTKNPVSVENPGGASASGGFEKTFDMFFEQYFTQSFLKASGILDYLSNPVSYKNNLESGKRGGRSVGITTGYRWITNVKVG